MTTASRPGFILFGTSLAAAALIGLSPVPAALVVGGFALAVLVRTLMRGAIGWIPFTLIALYAYALTSAIVLGGADAIGTDPIAWLSGEGRFFIAFWPLIFFTAFPARAAETHDIGLPLLVLSIAISIPAWLSFSGVYPTFSSHHAAGAVGAALFIPVYFHLLSRRTVFSALLAANALVLLLAANSRTALLGVFLAIGIVHVARRQWRFAVTCLVLAALALSLLPLALPQHAQRWREAWTPATLASLTTNFSAALSAETAAETIAAWDLASRVTLEGNANLAIRGYLWGRAAREALRSPLIGTGFGRFNDLGRIFEPVFAGYVATGATYANPGVLTAHNTYLHILSELGLAGALLLAAPLVVIGRTFLGAARSYWADTGLAALAALLVMGVTDHTLGAPIFGLSLAALAGLSYAVLAARPP